MAATGALAQFFLDRDYQGARVSLAAGVYNLEGKTNDAISSLKVPAGLEVTVYQDADLKGASRVFTADVPFIGADFNDTVSSIKITALNTDAQSSASALKIAAMTPGSAPDKDVTVPGDTQIKIAFTDPAVKAPAAGSESEGLKYLGFVQDAAAYAVTTFSNVYLYAKDKSGPLQPGVDIIEGPVKNVAVPLYNRFSYIPNGALKFVDRTVDASVTVIDRSLPPIVKDASSPKVTIVGTFDS
ncbi:peptidase inhibitor family I36 protein [Kitasatospora sp. NPDC089797]|uniref:peptidase inhibitor family I36 protein n=1 Tax=Kitasatospora sp. NPDC089797 TaxID=3155298 RepID=UPI003412521B